MMVEAVERKQQEQLMVMALAYPDLHSASLSSLDSYHSEQQFFVQLSLKMKTRQMQMQLQHALPWR